VTISAPAPPRFTLRRSLFFSTILFVGFFGIIEIALRVVGVTPSPRPGILLRSRDVDITFPFMKADPQLFWAPRPGFAGEFLGKPVSINHLGLRGPEPQSPKRGRRVVCFGDSITFGYGVGDTETYTSDLGSLLAAHQIETVNAGVTGYTSHQVLVLLRRIAPVIQADVATFCIGWNDGNRRPLDDREYGRRLAVATRTDGILDDVFIYQLLKSLYVRAATAPSTESGRVERVSPDQYVENLKALVAVCQAQGIRPVFVALPHRKLAGEALVTYAYTGLLRGTAQSLGVPLVEARELTPESTSPDTSALFIDSLHFSVAGNTLMAEEMARQLLAAGVL
jgi:lysophospholipase L1-like esterase